MTANKTQHENIQVTKTHTGTLCKGKYSVVTFKVEKIIEHRHSYYKQDKVNLNNIFYY